MPVTLSGLIATVVGTGAVGAALQTGLATLTIALGAIGSTALGVLLSTGLSYLAQSLFRPSQPKPEDVQQSFRQPTAPRVRHYGRVKVAGPWVFAEAKAGFFYKVLALGQGPIDGVEQFWIDDNNVSIDSSDFVTTAPYSSKCKIQYRLGAATETSYSDLSAIFPEWTSAHRGDGVASLFARQYPVDDANYLATFPNGINTSYRLVIRGAKIENPVTSTVAWSDNAAAIIRDYIVHADGMRLPASVVNTTKAAAGWVAAYNRAAESVDLSAGGSESRYRIWGSYRLDERPADVLSRMMAVCDGRLVPTSDGGLTLDIGDWSEPTVTLDADTITGISDLGRGRDILTTANTIRATYLDPAQDYQATDADPWVDAADVSDRGEIAQDLAFNMSPSHTQTRRLMKLAAYRANPKWTATFQCNLPGLAAIDQRFVRIDYPLFGINSVFEIQDLKFVIGEGNILTGVLIQAQSMPEAAYQWDKTQDEGDAPVSDDTDVDNTIPVPDAPTADLVEGPPIVANLSFSPSPSTLLHIEAQGRNTADPDWTPIAIDASGTSAVSFELTEDEEYEFQLRYVTEKGRAGDWSASATVTPNFTP